MQSNTCQIQGHDQRRINAICFDTKCEGKRVCCQKCLLEFHADHVASLVDIDDILKYIRTSSDQHGVFAPKVNQVLIELTKVLNYIDCLQNLIKQEIDRLSYQSLSNICKNIGNKYNIFEVKVESLENQQWDQLAQDMLKDFNVQEGKIIMNDSFVHQSGQQYFKSMYELSQIMIKLVNEFQFSEQILAKKVPKKTYFEAFTEQQVLTGHTALVRGIDICKQRNLLSSGGDDYVKLWDLNNHQLIKTYTHSGGVYDVVFSNQGNLLAFAGGWGDYSIKLIDISDLKKDNVIIDLKGHFGQISRLTFSNDSKYLISGSYDQKIIFWDVILQKESFQLNLESCVNGVAINSDDTLITSNSLDGKIRIWTIQNPKLLCTQQAHPKGAGINFSNDKKMLVSSGYDGTIKLWSLEKSNQSQLILIREFKAATKCIWTVLFSPCSGFIICMSNPDREIKVLDSLTGEVVKLFKSKATNGNNMIQVAISKDMDIIAYGEDTNIAVWTRK